MRTTIRDHPKRAHFQAHPGMRPMVLEIFVMYKVLRTRYIRYFNGLAMFFFLPFSGKSVQISLYFFRSESVVQRVQNMRRLLLVLFVASLTCGVSKAALYATWTFDGAETSSPILATATDGNQGGLATLTTYVPLNVYAFDVNNDLILASGQYFILHVTPTSGNHGFGVSYSVEGSGPGDTPLKWSYGTDGTTFGGGFTDYIGTGSLATWSDEFSNSGNPTDLYFKVEAIGSGSLTFDSISFGGAVPEPINVALAFFGVLAMGGTAGYRFLVSRKAKKA